VDAAATLGSVLEFAGSHVQEFNLACSRQGKIPRQRKVASNLLGFLRCLQTALPPGLGDKALLTGDDSFLGLREFSI
jgi:hypothetical protein